LAPADGAALPCFGLETLVLPFLALPLHLVWMGSDSSSNLDPVSSLGAGDSAHTGASAEGTRCLQGETHLGAEGAGVGLQGAGIDS
jgi:hypothetical protein